MRESIAVGDNSRVAADLGLRRVGEDAKDRLALEVRNREGDWRNAGDIGLRNGNDAVRFNGYTGVQGTKTVDICIAWIEGQVKASFAVSIYTDVN